MNIGDYTLAGNGKPKQPNKKTRGNWHVTFTTPEGERDEIVWDTTEWGARVRIQRQHKVGPQAITKVELV